MLFGESAFVGETESSYCALRLFTYISGRRRGKEQKGPSADGKRRRRRRSDCSNTSLLLLLFIKRTPPPPLLQPSLHARLDVSVSCPLLLLSPAGTYTHTHASRRPYHQRRGPPPPPPPPVSSFFRHHPRAGFGAKDTLLISSPHCSL